MIKSLYFQSHLVVLIVLLMFLISCTDNKSPKSTTSDSKIYNEDLKNNSNCEKLNSKDITSVELFGNDVYGLKNIDEKIFVVKREKKKWQKVGGKGFIQLESGGVPESLYALKNGEKVKGQLLTIRDNKWKRLKGKGYYDLAVAKDLKTIYLIKDTKKSKGKVYSYNGEKLSALRNNGFTDIEINNNDLYALKNGKTKNGVLYKYNSMSKKWTRLKTSNFENLQSQNNVLNAYKNGIRYSLVNDKFVKAKSTDIIDTEENTNFSLTLKLNNQLELCPKK